ncbi:membrane-anchored junction protein isoform X1 [Corvus hawaiiensis]|uniref:membrane-anchored junction protein isoform X1 n=1 Tax=Corvus hawaiiensis TaxID=134902 RepID=UPI002018962F|nr:membrane-anchored junction protein isoform X1 [Corvus hawaiiensis]XP_048171555.1 membrane-anchored junction protein isoform X1 [Corvus hawaiiensis]XP_048171556.1 membrane-anchored junction protein isoform X1 [Corvus hawaiiensis]XP_048171557.1 membrane-anchored junction protein isoform X1 [Corvus hawaiiensis]
MSLKPFAYPLPETRFLHAGRLVYKFKIRYGNFSSPPNLNLTESAAKESEEVIRVILGNLDDLHPFSTDHFTIFPYLSKWEQVSKMKFKHENVHLVPYPYVCTLYLELNSFQQNFSCGKEVNKGSDELRSQNQLSVPNLQCLKVKRRDEMSESTAVEEAVKRRRVEVRAETSWPQPCVDRTGADGVHHMSKPEHGFKKNSSNANGLEFSPASHTKDCDQMSFWEPVEFALEERVASQAEGAVQLLQQQVDQTGKKGNMKSEGRGLSKFWRSIIFSPLQHLFGGKN